MGRPRARLGFWYRVRWNIHYALLSVMGPPQLDAAQDPRMRLRAERAERERRLAEGRDQD
jgi:hypothetical protein